MSDTIFVKGVWKILRPDIRQYKQQSIEIELTAEVGVRVPNTEEFVFSDTNVLTPAGMAYVQKQFEASYPMDAPNDGWSNNKPVIEKPVATDDGWSTVTDVAVKAEPASAKVDSWGDEPTFDSNFPPDPNLPVTETWNPDDEEWSS